MRYRFYNIHIKSMINIVKSGDKVIAMARLLLTHVEEYIRAQLQPGWEGYLQLVSAKEKEKFYEKLGYAIHPHEHSGPGISKWIKR